MQFLSRHEETRKNSQEEFKVLKHRNNLNRLVARVSLIYSETMSEKCFQGKQFSKKSGYNENNVSEDN